VLVAESRNFLLCHQRSLHSAYEHPDFSLGEKLSVGVLPAFTPPAVWLLARGSTDPLPCLQRPRDGWQSTRASSSPSVLMPCRKDPASGVSGNHQLYMFGLQSSYSRWITASYFLFILHFRNRNAHDGPRQVPDSFQLRLTVSAADTRRSGHAKNWDEFTKRTTEKKCFKESRDHRVWDVQVPPALPRASPSGDLGSAYCCFAVRSPVTGQGSSNGRRAQNTAEEAAF